MSLVIGTDVNAERLDILDPMGQPREDFERLYGEVEPLLRRVVEWVGQG